MIFVGLTNPGYPVVRPFKNNHCFKSRPVILLLVCVFLDIILWNFIYLMLFSDLIGDNMQSTDVLSCICNRPLTLT